MKDSKLFTTQEEKQSLKPALRQPGAWGVRLRAPSFSWPRQLRGGLARCLVFPPKSKWIKSWIIQNQKINVNNNIAVKVGLVICNHSKSTQSWTLIMLCTVRITCTCISRLLV